MLTLDEAIKHCEEKAKELRKDYERAVALNIPSEGCLECANEHEQLAEWLEDYKRLLEKPKGDLISREALIKAFITSNHIKETVSGLDVMEMLAIKEIIDNAPTTPLFVFRSRPIGQWIRKVDDVGFVSHICSKCGAEIEVEDCSDDKFCFNCGAEMKKGGAE